MADKNTTRWSMHELALLLKHSNEEVARLTGRAMEEVEQYRLRNNIERNCWDRFDPERAI
ncbi:hypothetical protein [Superficieibacter sp. 1612_C1]|uniref:hypothetical protein n=1 Tax=Superficieibacter sp. 1612_C1 TaxID=2780382 RepID=UPI0018840C74|nr:hypothetical protein [Superficieibacter sp. 1612_C1]